MPHPCSPYRQLQPEDRVSIASLRQQGLGIRAIALVLARSPRTISRELHRNAHEQGYASTAAQARCHQRRLRPRPAPKLDTQGVLFDVAHYFLQLHWSPQQIALTLARIYPKGHPYRVSHETIYNCIYALSVGELRRELVACLRQARKKRTPRSKGQDRSGQIPDLAQSTCVRPRLRIASSPVIGNGDIKGAGNASAVGTLVERTSRLLMLVNVPHPQPASAANVLQAFTDKVLGIAEPMRQTLTYDQGREMARHKELTAATKVAVYFCDPHSPWQRGSNKNTKGLMRQYLPKGTDLSDDSQEQLDAIADEINSRPRKGLGVRSPLAVYRELLINSPSHSTLVH